MDCSEIKAKMMGEAKAWLTQIDLGSSHSHKEALETAMARVRGWADANGWSLEMTHNTYTGGRQIHTNHNRCLTLRKGGRAYQYQLIIHSTFKVVGYKEDDDPFFGGRTPVYEEKETYYGKLERWL